MQFPLDLKGMNAFEFRSLQKSALLDNGISFPIYENCVLWLLISMVYKQFQQETTISFMTGEDVILKLGFYYMGMYYMYHQL
jgi:hypothetical protein